MDPLAEEELLIALAIQHVKAQGEWPKLEVLHRQIHQGSDTSVATLEVARRLAPKPFLGGGYSWLGETFAPTPDLIVRVDKGREVLAAVVSWINLARTKYRTADGQPEITSAEFIEEADVDQPTADAVRVVLGWFSDTTDGEQWNEKGWVITVADEIISWPQLGGVEDLLEEWSRRQDRHQELRALADDAKHQLLVGTGRVAASPQTGARVLWTEKSWAKSVLWAVAVLGGIASGIAIWNWFS